MAHETVALILSEENELSAQVTKELLSNNVSPIFTSEKNKSPIENLLEGKVVNIDYVITILSSPFSYEFNEELYNADNKRLKLAVEFCNKETKKLLIISSLNQGEKQFSEEGELLGGPRGILKTNLKVIYLGDLLTDDKNLFYISPLGEVIKNILINGSLIVSNSFSFYPLSVTAAARQVTEELFSLSPSGHTTAILGKQFKASSLRSVLPKGTKYKSVYVDTDKKIFQVKPKSKSLISSKRKSFYKIKELVLGMPRDLRKVDKKKRDIPFIKNTRKLHLNIKRKYLFIIATIVLLTPLWSSFLTSIVLGVANRSLLSGDFETSYMTTKLSYPLFTVTKIFTTPLPVFKKENNFLLKNADFHTRLNSSLDMSYEIYKRLKGTAAKDIETKELLLNLRAMHDDLNYIQIFLSSEGSFITKFASKSFDKENLTSYKTKLLSTYEIVERLDGLLGKSGEKNYLITFEDNSLLMPGGGKIRGGHFLRISGSSINENREILKKEDDSINKITVKPPQMYSGKINKDIHFSASNLSPIFSDSAQKEIFLAEKSLDTKIDGIISILGSNYEKTLEVRRKNDFFKLLSWLIEKEVKNDINFYFSEQSVNERLIEIYPEIFERGEMCTDECYSDFYKYFELSLTPQKDIQRETFLQVSQEEKIVKRRLTVLLSNKGDDAYKYYSNIMIPEDVGLSPVAVLDDEKVNNITHTEVYADYKVIGVYAEVKPGDTKSIIYSWESGNETKTNKYFLRVGKQGGMEDTNVKISFKSPNREIFTSNSNLTLTNGNEVIYNTVLRRDISFEANYK